MKKSLFRLTLAAGLLACLTGAASAAPAPTAQLGIKASVTPSSAPFFTLGDLTMQPIGIKYMDDDYFYVLCAKYPDGHTDCKKIAPTSLMRGIEVRSAMANDGVTPLVWYMQTEALTPDAGDKQSAAIAVFDELLSQTVAEFATPNASAAIARTCPRGRAPRNAATKDCADGGDDADPDPSSVSAPPLANLTQVEVPGPRPDPEYPTFDPPFSDPSAPPPPDDPGNAGGDSSQPEQPDGSSWRRIKTLKETCIALPPPLIGGGCVIKVPMPKPPLVDPDHSPLPPGPTPPLEPPRFDWCALAGIGCSYVDQMPTPDPRFTACSSKFIVDAVACWDKRNKGKYTPDQADQCYATKYAELQKCRATLGVPVTAAAAQ